VLLDCMSNLDALSEVLGNCNGLQQTATSLQHSATILQHPATHFMSNLDAFSEVLGNCNRLQQTATDCNITATLCNNTATSFDAFHPQETVCIRTACRTFGGVLKPLTTATHCIITATLCNNTATTCNAFHPQETLCIRTCCRIWKRTLKPFTSSWASQSLATPNIRTSTVFQITTPTPIFVRVFVFFMSLFSRQKDDKFEGVLSWLFLRNLCSYVLCEYMCKCRYIYMHICT